MIKDLDEYDDRQTSESDICVVGAGAAGITLALELAKSGRNVILLESGGHALDWETQALYTGENVGRQYFELVGDRLRFLGGTTNHWGGWCSPLTPLDLQQRSWLPGSGWPMEWNELDRYYPTAQAYCEIGEYQYDPRGWAPEYSSLLPVRADKFDHFLYRFSRPTQFGSRYRGDLEKAANITVLLHANLVDIEFNDNRQGVSAVAVRSLKGKPHRIRARSYVIACGGIENARILLACKNQHADGVGNQRGLVGRFFMDHMEGSIGKVIVSRDADARRLGIYSKMLCDGKSVQSMASLRIREGTQRDAELLSASYSLMLNQDPVTGYLSAKRIAERLLGRRPSDGIGADFRSMLLDLDEIGRWIHHRTQGTHYEFPVTMDPAIITISSEQSPNPDSRVMLGNQLDRLGIPMPQLDWRISGEDKERLRRGALLFAEEMARVSGMRIKLDDWLLDDSSEIPHPEIQGGHHHMGTTRMAGHPSLGVVDQDCRVFDVDNLYITGSSVFPTGGYANPTLTIVALSARLARHLEGQ